MNIREAETPCSAGCGYYGGGQGLADHERFEHADCPRCGAKAPALDGDGVAYSVTHKPECLRLRAGHRYEEEAGCRCDGKGCYCAVHNNFTVTPALRIPPDEAPPAVGEGITGLFWDNLGSSGS